jgi:hypothetical protein
MLRLCSETHHKTGTVGLIGVIADSGIDGIAKGLGDTQANPTATMTRTTVDAHKWFENVADLIGWDTVAIIAHAKFAMAGTHS